MPAPLWFRLFMMALLVTMALILLAVFGAAFSSVLEAVL